ncbi:metalloprotease PmbA [Burkholderia territorii]|uniref:metalloprotease PmbA n=1 Tax=Burkholderia territorii TaxID=1503055 RepID=UPI00075F06C3|nr:metalloprotease PmbA [Burkholderia territorii]KVT78867.1 metalloprotease PmbA [Burkholderia territorii]
MSLSAESAAAVEPVFVHARAELDDIAGELVQAARSAGASDAVARVTESSHLEVGVREARAEMVQCNRTQAIELTVFEGRRSGSATSTDFTPAARQAVLAAARHIARHTGEDPCAGPAERTLLEMSPPDLDLWHPWRVSTDEAIELARRAEDAARRYSASIVNGDGASVSAFHTQFALATSQGFSGGYAQSRHVIGCSVIAGDPDGMQADAWRDVRRRACDLDTPEAIGQRAAQRAQRMLGARRVPTGTWPVLFEAPVAAHLVHALVSAVSGGALYRSQSFLPDSIGTQVLADHLGLRETPHEPRGLASAPFDDDGVRTLTRDVVHRGVLQGYFLSAYSARKLDMVTTAHAGGAHNLSLTSTHTALGDDFAAMVRRLDRGLIVTSLMGDGINRVTGDYSRGAAGLWVENGQIQYPVHEITIAGNLIDMLREIVAIGTDVHATGVRTGSILIERMRIAGI